MGEFHSFVKTQGPTLQIKVPKKDGSVMVLDAPSAAGFVVGQDLGADFADERSLRVLRADTRFQEI
jgi:hypothetical protein